MSDKSSPTGEGARPGDQQQALDAEVGSPRPEYDQYEMNQAGNINKQADKEKDPRASRPQSGD